MDIPKIVRRGTGVTQLFEVSNPNDFSIAMGISAANLEGDLSYNLNVNKSNGILLPYAIRTVSNVDLQIRDVLASEQEPATLCYRSDELAGSFHGRPLQVRELRILSGRWVSTTLDTWWNFWSAIYPKHTLSLIHISEPTRPY